MLFTVNFTHVFTTMQCGAMARVVFVKSVKQVEAQVNYSRINTMHTINGNAADQDEEYTRAGANKDSLNDQLDPELMGGKDADDSY